MPGPRSNIANEATDFQADPVERREAGRGRLKAVPLEAHAEAAPGAGRADPLKILARQEKTRLPELMRLRYGE